ncbi:MAG: type IV pilus twitching motility protein PilT [Myxococcales bacterium]|nr:type IV pilus twitching motility protein PilT [Myxococcales bacterium]
MAQIDRLLTMLKDEGASDLHLAATLEPRFRKSGRLTPIPGEAALSDEQLRDLLEEITNQKQWSEYSGCGDLDFAHAIPGVARFRANYFTQENGAGAVFRIIPEDIIPAEDLGLPDAIVKLADLEQGLVLVTGPTGSGKSTTLAAIIHRINTHHEKHIVTIEDPVEFVHQNRKCVISHREVGDHTDGFGGALRAVIRQDANIILVGEMRDYETISLAITAAEMGSLVFGTLHTNSAAKTIDRIVDAFPAEEQSQVRISLAESLSAVVSQLLLPTADGKGRCAAHEILLRTQGLGNVIREGNTPMISSIIQGGKNVGMQSMDDRLFELVKEGRVKASDAMMKANDKPRFEPLVAQEK